MTSSKPVDSQTRIAVYDDLLSSPRIIDIAPAPILDFIENIASTTYESVRSLGGSLPYTVIREIAENFIHADFKECTVSVLNNGNTVRFSDQGPGIEKKDLVLQPGISSATAEMKHFIRGVGSGFPLVREYLEHTNGYLSIDDNAVEGVVVTLTTLTKNETQALQDHRSTTASILASRNIPPRDPVDKRIFSSETGRVTKETFSLSELPAQVNYLKPREEQTLLLLYKEGMLGSGDLTEPLGISAPTATRLLQRLEQLGFVEVSSSKKRILSNEGLAYIQERYQ